MGFKKFALLAVFSLALAPVIASGAIYRTLGIGATSTITMASFAPGESGTLPEGTPVQIVTYPLVGAGSDEHKIKVCPDASKPDAVVVRVISTYTAGQIMYLGGDRLPILAGAAFAKGAKLKVSSGRFITAATSTNAYYVIAREAAAAANDIVPGYLFEGVIP